MINPRIPPLPEIFSVRRDKNFTHTSNNHVIKVPRYKGFSTTPGLGTVGQVGNEPGMEGDVILDRNTRLLCYHNGFTWVCLGSGTADTTTLTGLCPGDGDLVVSGVGPNLSIRGLAEGSGITLTPGANCITITATAGIINTLEGLCPGVGDLVVSGVGPNLSIKGLEPGPGITLDPSGTCITITATAGVIPTLDGLCPGIGDLVVGNVGPNLSIKGLSSGEGIKLTASASCVEIATDLVAGPGISLEGAGTAITISANLAAGDGITLSDSGTVITITADAAATITLDNLCPPPGISLVGDGTGPALKIKGLSSGDGIKLTDGASCVEISTDLLAGPGISLEGAGTAITISANLAAGDGITLSDSGTAITITADAAETITLDNLCPPPGISLVGDGTGPTLKIKGLNSGDGIKLTDGASCVEIATDLLAGPGISLEGAGTAITISANLIGGDGIMLSDSGTAITITADAAETITLDNLCPLPGISLVSDGTGPALKIKGLSSGEGIKLTDGASCVEIATDLLAGPGISLEGAGTAITISANLAAGDGITLSDSGTVITITADAAETITLDNLCPPPGISLVGDGTGPTLKIKGLSSGDGIKLTDGASCVEIATDLLAGPGISLEGAGTAITISANLIGGDGITLSDSGTAITITADAVATITLDNLCPPPGISLVGDGTGPALKIKGLSSGDGIKLTDGASCVEISTDLVAGPGISLEGAGTAITISANLIGGDGITLSDSGTAITITADAAAIVSVQQIDTIMRTESSAISLEGIVGSVTFTDPCLGILNGADGATGGSIVTYTPNPRVPMWPERVAYDSCSFSGTNSSGSDVQGVVNICISCVCPSDRYIITPFSGTYDPDTDTDIASVNFDTETQTILKVGGGGNLMATNNVDGIVLSREGTTAAVGVVRFWDPVSDVTGIIDISGLANYADALDTTGAAAFDNDRAHYLIFGDAGGTTESTMWYYRLSIEKYITGTTPIIQTLDQVRLYTNNALSTDFTSALGDASWDFISKKVYITTTDGDLYYFYPYDMRWNTSGLACQVFAQGTDIAGVGGLQSTFIMNGSEFYVHETGGTRVFLVNRKPDPATVTQVATMSSLEGPIDAAEWPCTILASDSPP